MCLTEGRTDGQRLSHGYTVRCITCSRVVKIIITAKSLLVCADSLRLISAFPGLKMSTSQQQLPSGTWTDTFPENQVSELQSTAFMKKLLAIAISNIAYMRVIFPEEVFSDRHLEGLNLKILKNDKSCPSAVQMVDWLKGVFDAIDKKYLRALIFGIYRSSSDPNTLLEMYNFKFSYSNKTEMEIYSGNKKISSASTATQTKKATISLLRNLIVLIQTLRPLPDDVRITMKLFYYDDVTPEDYEPPGFRAAETDFVCMEGNPAKFKFQSVSTAFHSLGLRVIADTTMAGEDETVTVPGDQQMTEDVPRAMDVEMGDTQSQQENFVESTTPESSAKAKHCSQTSTATTVDDENSPAGERNGDEDGVRCPCVANEDDGLMIQCSVCSYWQHAVCFKILDESLAPARHVCHLCCNSAAETTDPELAEVHESEAQMICLWRRSLAACLEVNHISCAQLACRLGVADSLASCLMDRLISEGYASAKGKLSSSVKFIQKRKIKRDALMKYFSKNSVTTMEVES